MKNRQDDDTDDLLGSIVTALRKNEPRLKDSEEIPDKVIQSIQHMRQQKSPDGITRSSRIRYLTYAQRLLTAASVCLLILYGAEEFIVVKKLNTLEQQTAAVRIDPTNTIFRRLVKSGITVTTLKQRFPNRLKLLAAQEHLFQNQTVESLKNLLP